VLDLEVPPEALGPAGQSLIDHRYGCQANNINFDNTSALNTVLRRQGAGKSSPGYLRGPFYFNARAVDFRHRQNHGGGWRVVSHAYGSRLRGCGPNDTAFCLHDAPRSAFDAKFVEPGGQQPQRALISAVRTGLVASVWINM